LKNKSFEWAVNQKNIEKFYKNLLKFLREKTVSRNTAATVLLTRTQFKTIFGLAKERQLMKLTRFAKIFGTHTNACQSTRRTVPRLFRTNGRSKKEILLNVQIILILAQELFAKQTKILQQRFQSL